MFRKSVITDEVSQDFQTAVNLALKYRLDAVEIRSVWERNPFELTKEDTAQMKDILSDAGLTVCCISAPFYKCSLNNDAEIASHIEGLKRSIELADALGAKLIRGFTFWDEGNFEENLERIAAQFETPIALLKDAGMRLALEFDPSVYASNARTLMQVLDQIDSPQVGALWDPGNDVYDPRGEVAYPDGYELVKSRMIHMHLKDAKKEGDEVKAMPVGCGEVDFRGQFAALLRDGYDGYVSLETHYRPAFELSEESMRLPKGSVFSYKGEEASEECLQNWEKLMQSL